MTATATAGAEPISPDQVLDFARNLPKGRRGLDGDAITEVLVRAGYTMNLLAARMSDAERRALEAENRPAPAPMAMAPVPAPVPAAPSAEVVAAAADPDGSSTARSVRILDLAQSLADQIDADARAAAERLQANAETQAQHTLHAATTEAERLVLEAEQEVARTLGDLPQRRADLAAEVEMLSDMIARHRAAFVEALDLAKARLLDGLAGSPLEPLGEAEPLALATAFDDHAHADAGATATTAVWPPVL